MYPSLEATLFDRFGTHIGHDLTILPILDEHDSDRPDAQRRLFCETCDRVVLTVDNPELEG